MCPHATMYVISYCYMCPHTAICVIILSAYCFFIHLSPYWFLTCVSLVWTKLVFFPPLYIRPPPVFLHICPRTVFVCVSHSNLPDTDDEAKGFVARVRRVELLYQHTSAYVSIRQHASTYVKRNGLLREYEESNSCLVLSYVSSYCYMCPHTTKCALILL